MQARRAPPATAVDTSIVDLTTWPDARGGCSGALGGGTGRGLTPSRPSGMGASARAERARCLGPPRQRRSDADARRVVPVLTAPVVDGGGIGTYSGA